MKMGICQNSLFVGKVFEGAKIAAEYQKNIPFQLAPPHSGVREKLVHSSSEIHHTDLTCKLQIQVSFLGEFLITNITWMTNSFMNLYNMLFKISF